MTNFRFPVANFCPTSLGSFGKPLSPILILLGLFVLGNAHAARLALVIGNDQYQHISTLRNAVADATSIAEALRRAGYKVTQSSNRDLKTMKDELRAFRRRIQGGDEVVLFFSGHGVQVGGENYLLPVDVRAEGEDQVRDDAVVLSALLADIRSARPALTLAVIDACRDNPFVKNGKSIGGRGLTRVSSATGEMVLFAAGEGQQALDRLGVNDAVRNGVFTRVFVKEIEKPGVPIDQVMRNVRVEVARLAQSVGHEQVPAVYDQVLGTFYFYAIQSPRLDPRPPIASVTETARSEPLEVFPDSSQRYLRTAEVEALARSKPNLVNIAKNEIFARHGRKFIRADLNRHFTQFKWYKPLYSDDTLIVRMFNQYETANVELLYRYDQR